jgi:hypothetical protein
VTSQVANIRFVPISGPFIFRSLVYLVCRYNETRPHFRQLPAHEGFDLSLKGQEVKYRDSFEFTPFARLLFSANRLSASEQNALRFTTNAFWGREKMRAGFFRMWMNRRVRFTS